MQRTVEEKTELFETMPIRKAAMTLIIPTVISQLVMLVYNMADTWYIGQTGDPYQVAAVTVTYPIFMLMNALANLFGIGGSSLVSRMLGSGKRKETGAVAGFSLWAAGGASEVIPCTACRYCTDTCPKKIAIPDYFALYNNMKRSGDTVRLTTRTYYSTLTQTHGKASECLKCGRCEKLCPQHLPIRKYLQDVATALE